jgi:signal-transduction protein with cAMP-binding, CBS, and nucleotidyltransferase domain
MNTVSDILDSKTKSDNQIGPDMLVIDALRMLQTVNLSYLIVLDGNQYKGIFSERDYCRNVILQGRSSSTTKVQEAMTSDLPVVAMGDAVEYCMNLMNQQKTRYLLAFDGPVFMGVITIHDLLRQVMFTKGTYYDSSLGRSTMDLIDSDESDRFY